MYVVYVFFNDTATTAIYTYGNTLSLHDALPIFGDRARHRERVGDLAKGSLDRAFIAGKRRIALRLGHRGPGAPAAEVKDRRARIAARRPGKGADRKSTRLNSSH